ncbi:Uncharacterised protein [Vibrio cholerae]|nr:Uncharacterised protein [Vibrio cholerae]
MIGNFRNRRQSRQVTVIFTVAVRHLIQGFRGHAAITRFVHLRSQLFQLLRC